MTKPAIIVNHLTKKYRIGEIYENSFKQILGQWLKLEKKPAKTIKEFYALNDLSFKVEKGEVLGIVGHNGAGKSTLLKVLSRITEPTSGEARVYGRVGTLLEIGTGFHPDLTGLENIFLNGAILGMRQQEIQQQLDKIVDFSGIEKFIHTPVKYYSSGMTVRLAFSVAAHLQADIIFLDEVWGAGDQDFSKKSIAKMKSIVKSGRTVIVISHDLSILNELCTRCLWMEQGKILLDDSAKTVIETYKSSVKHEI
jgi:lipopolysaccharide transport system ATP-binding protein